MMEKDKFIKIPRVNIEFVYLILEILLFVLILVFLLLVLLGWGYEEITEKQRDSYVEVSLPVIEWAKYSNLSKAKDGGKFE